MKYESEDENNIQHLMTKADIYNHTYFQNKIHRRWQYRMYVPQNRALFLHMSYHDQDLLL